MVEVDAIDVMTITDNGKIAEITAARAASPVQLPGSSAVIATGWALTVPAPKHRPLLDFTAANQPFPSGEIAMLIRRSLADGICASVIERSGTWARSATAVAAVKLPVSRLIASAARSTSCRSLRA